MDIAASAFSRLYQLVWMSIESRTAWWGTGDHIFIAHGQEPLAGKSEVGRNIVSFIRHHILLDGLYKS